MADIVLAALVLAPFTLTLILKSNAALGYLALCGSFVLITLGSAELTELTGHLDLRVDSSTLNLILLMVPLLLTLLVTRRAFSNVKKFGSLLQLAVALCAGGLLALVSVPLLNASARADFANSWGWDNIQTIQAPIIAAGFVFSLLLVWFSKSKAAKKHK